MESTQEDPRIGVVLNGRYRITEQLGEGGMGLVYRGERVQLGRPVAIKFLHSPYAHSSRFVQRFQREARAMSKLSHPYCVSVLDFGVHEAPYIVMDFVTGTTLRHAMDQGRMPPQRALQIAKQLLVGLSHAHGQGVIHRDIKPGNIMLGEATGLGDHVRIFDFGLAKLHDPELDGEPSMAAIVGTPAYMAPEQARADKVDARADLYAAGIVLFEMLTGQKPFQGSEAYEILCMQRDQAPPRLRAVGPELSPELEALVSRALEKDPDKRFQTATEFAAALESVPEWNQNPQPAPHVEEIGYAKTLISTTTPIVSSQILASQDLASQPEPRTVPVTPVAPKPRKKRGGGLLAMALLGGAAFVGWRLYGQLASLDIIKAAQPASGPETAPAAAESAPKTAAAPQEAKASRTSASKPAEEPAPEALLDVPSEPGEKTLAEAEAVLAAAAEAVRDLVREAVPAGGSPSAPEAVPGDPEAAADGGEGNDLSEAALAAADEQLNDTVEREVRLPTPPANSAPKVQSVADVRALIAKGRVEDAIRGVQQLRRQTPRMALLPFMLGTLYIDKGWWSDGLAKYRETIKLSAAYRKNQRIQRDAIHALGDDRTHARARALLVRDIGKLALPALKRAAARDPSPTVKKRAAAVAKQISR